MGIIEADLMRYSVVRDLGRGTSFPASADVPGGLQDFDRFYRTDINMACFYGASVWITAHEYEQNLTPYFRQAQPHTGGAAVLLVAPCRTDYDAYVTRTKVLLDVATTNNGTNYWTLTLKYAGTTVYTFNTSADAPNTNLNKENLPLTGVAAGAFSWFETTSKTGTPGSIVVNATIWYRLIIV